MNFDEAFTILLGHEGGYVNNPSDPGGATRWGITERVARRNGYAGPMQELPVEIARSIAKREYWDAIKAELMPVEVRFDLFDTSYNSGPREAVVLLQRALGVDDDGVIGRQTLDAIDCINPDALSRRFNGHRLEFMADLATWSTFGRGWARRIAANLKRA